MKANDRFPPIPARSAFAQLRTLATSGMINFVAAYWFPKPASRARPVAGLAAHMFFEDLPSETVCD